MRIHVSRSVSGLRVIIQPQYKKSRTGSKGNSTGSIGKDAEHIAASLVRLRESGQTWQHVLRCVAALCLLYDIVYPYHFGRCARRSVGALADLEVSRRHISLGCPGV